MIDFKQRVTEFLDCGGGIKELHYPLELYTIYCLGSYVLGSLLSAREFQDISFTHVSELLQSLNFTEIYKDQDFKKEERNYEGKIIVYFHDNAFVHVRIGEEIDDEFDILTGEPKRSHDNNLVTIHVFYKLEELNKEFLNGLFKELERISLIDHKVQTKNTINFLCYGHNFHLKKIKVDKKEVNLEMNYGKEFLKVHHHLVKFLDSDETGLVILYGVPSTGKTSYCRHLLSVLNKKVIYIPPNLISRVAEPDFLTFLLNQNDFVLIIEDAEEIVTNRQDAGNTSAVSNLLNLSDGILGDCVKARILCTFNTELKNIDPALVRKGRLKIQHEFKMLDIDQSNRLFKHLNIQHITKEPMVLGDIFNFNEENFRKEKKKEKVGFGK